MRNYRNTLFYISVTSVFSAIIYWVVMMGHGLEQGKDLIVTKTNGSQWDNFLAIISHNLQHPLALLLAQIVTIILVAKLFGWICKKIAQPTVIGEMIAGIVLGPSLVGLYFPDFSLILFPTHSLGNLQFLSQIGLILFMYIVGMEVDLSILRNKAQNAIIISHASIIIPFAMGMGLAYFIYPSFAPANVQFLSFALFMGIAMSITAFPVLARIVQERGIHKTNLGTIVITCAAADDITAWCILAAVIAIVKAGSVVSSLFTIALAISYVVGMMLLVRPFLRRISNIYTTRESLGKGIVSIFFLTLIVSSYITEVIGIHALFGAFMAGVIMPESTKFRNILIGKIEDVALVLLLPLFFVYTGLRTQIGLLDTTDLWLVAGVIVLVAVTGKMAGSAFAARFVGLGWKESLSIGALMNTRGLMELVVLNIGYDMGVLSPEIFAMMVVMALGTTFMTGPALHLIEVLFVQDNEKSAKKINKKHGYHILLSFARPESAIKLMRLASSLSKEKNEKMELTAMHISKSEGLHNLNTHQYEEASFGPIMEEAARLGQRVMPLFKVSSDINGEIADEANKGQYDLLLLGLGHSIYHGSILGKVLGFTNQIINPENIIHSVTGRDTRFENTPLVEKTRQILMRSQVPVGILVDKDFSSTNRVFVPYLNDNDHILLSFVNKLALSGSMVDVINLYDGTNEQLQQSLGAFNLKNHEKGGVSIISNSGVSQEFMARYDLMLISLETWKQLTEANTQWLQHIPSAFIIARPENKNIHNK